METKEKIMRKIKSLIYLNSYIINKVIVKLEYISYEGLKKIIRKNKKNRYEEVLNFFKTMNFYT